MHNEEPREAAVRMTAVVRGMVQGVGFRYLTARQAETLGLGGSAINKGDGSVEIVVEGPEASARALLEWLESPRAPGSVTSVNAVFGSASGTLRGFQTG